MKIQEFFIHQLGDRPQTIHVKRARRRSFEHSVSRPTVWWALAPGAKFDQLHMLATLWGHLSYFSARPVYEVEPEQWAQIQHTVAEMLAKRSAA